MSEKKYIVTIARQFGSLGRPIAMRMSEKLGVEFYDRDIVEEAAKKLNLPVSKIDEIEESAKKKVPSNSFRRMMYPLGTQADELQDKLFEAQENIIKFLAERESCIIVGRCSDFILADETNLLRIYIYAPYEERVKNCVNNLKMDETDARTFLKFCKSIDHYSFNLLSCNSSTASSILSSFVSPKDKITEKSSALLICVLSIYPALRTGVDKYTFAFSNNSYLSYFDSINLLTPSFAT